MLDKNELRAEQLRLETSGQNNFLDNFVRMPDGEGIVVVRLLPPRNGGKLYCVTRTHKLAQRNLHCPQNLVGGKWQGFCPVCVHYRNLWKESDQKGGDEAEQLRAEARAIKPLERYYYNCIVRSVINQSGDVEKDVGPKILSIGKQLHARIIRAILGDPALDEPELGDVTDPKSGRDFKIIKRLRKSGTEAFPNYDESKFMQPSLLGTDKQQGQWMEHLHDLQALRQVKTNDEIMKELRIFRGQEKDESLAFEYGANSPAPVAPPVAPKTNMVAEDEDIDSALADNDFIRELQSM